MEYVSLYRRFRPLTFDNVIGQAHIVKTLTNQIAMGRISHAYLFTGTRGTGKTTCAKIFARAVNCLNPINGSPCGKCEICRQLANPNNMIDVIEMDAASNNGVAEIRDLKESVQYRSDFCKYKVYIIDEVHMLSGSAFNALLKTLEEPPEHVIFILATTEVQKLPQTILSRCMRFDFRLVSVEELTALLEKIFKELNVTYDIEALKQIAVHGEGSVRDTLSLADMVLSYCGNHISYVDTLEVLCASDFDTLNDLANAILSGDVPSALKITENLLKNGRNTVAKDLANYFIDCLEVKNADALYIDRISVTQKAKLSQTAAKYTNYRIARVMEIMASMENTLRYSTQPRIILEANVVRACELVTEVNMEGLTGRIRELENNIDELKKSGVKCCAGTDSNVQSVVEIKNEENVGTTETQETNINADKLLKENAVKAEAGDVFGITEENSDDGGLHIVLEKIRNNLLNHNEEMMETIISDVDLKKTRLEGDTLYIDDELGKSFFDMSSKMDTLRHIAKEVLGSSFEIVFAETNKEPALSEDERIMLTDLFGNKLIK